MVAATAAEFRGLLMRALINRISEHVLSPWEERLVMLAIAPFALAAGLLVLVVAGVVLAVVLAGIFVGIVEAITFIIETFKDFPREISEAF